MQNDPYLNTDNCVERLYREYTKHKRLIVAVDWDDTLWPFHGNDYKCDKLPAIIREAQALGFYIVIFTASVPSRFPLIYENAVKLGINIDSLNQNPIPLPYGNNGKIYFNILLDDRAGLAESFRILRKLLDKIGKNL